MGFLKRNSYIDQEELTYLKELLLAGIPLKTALALTPDESRAQLFALISERMDKGELVEEVLFEYLRKDLRDYLQALLKIMPFKEALELSLDFYQHQQASRAALMKSLLYPLTLLFVCVSVLFLFDCFGLDLILNLLRSFTEINSIIYFLRLVFRALITLSYGSLLVGALLFLYFSDPKRKELCYVLFTKRFKSSLLKTYYCKEFVALFLLCLKAGNKTQAALHILRSLKNRQLVSFLAFHLDEGLLKGQSIKEAIDQQYYDPSLVRFMHIASFSRDFKGVLSNYVELSEKRIAAFMKRLTWYLQLFSYVTIGLIVIFIYQMLFLPMQAIAAI